MGRGRGSEKAQKNDKSRNRNFESVDGRTHRSVSEVCGMSASAVGIEKPVVIDRKQNLREHRLYWVGRRAQDVVLSALALVVLLPVMLATAVAVVVDDPSAGPVFRRSVLDEMANRSSFTSFAPCVRMRKQSWTIC